MRILFIDTVYPSLKEKLEKCHNICDDAYGKSKSDIEKIITANREILTVILSPMPYPSPNAAPKIIIEQISPFNNPTPNSFINF